MKKSIERLPITVLTGFLGSGKTTLLNALLKQPAFRDSAIIVNEFGEIGLDHLLVGAAKERIVLLDAGCLCCTTLGSLSETLADLYHRRARGETPLFQRVLVETSGLAEPGPILRSILRDHFISRFFQLQALTCTVDARFGMGQLRQHPEAIQQVAVADRIVLTKVDMTGERSPLDLVAEIQRLNPFAPLQPAFNGVIDAGALIATCDARSAVPAWAAALTGDDRGHDDHQHTVGVTSHAFWLDRPITWSGIAAWTEIVRRKYGDRLLRCKGLLHMEGGDPVLLHGVQTMFDTTKQARWPTEDHRSRLICIGGGLDPDFLRRSLEWLHVPQGTQPPAGIDGPID